MSKESELTARIIRTNNRNGSGNENVDQELLNSTLDAAGLRRSNPVTEQAERIAAFFNGTKGVTTSFTYDENNENSAVFIFVSDPEQADWLNRVITHEYNFGGLILHVKVVQAIPDDITILEPPSDTVSLTGFEMLQLALKDNPNVVKFFSVYVPLFNVTYYFCETAPKLLFYQADDLSNIEGFAAVTPCELMKELFSVEGVFVSTQVPSYKKH